MMFVENRRKYRPPEDGRVDQFGRFCHVVVQCLRSFDNTVCSLARLAGERRLQQEWADLERSRIVEPGTEMKDLLLERECTFEVFDDDNGQSWVSSLPGALLRMPPDFPTRHDCAACRGRPCRRRPAERDSATSSGIGIAQVMAR